MVSNENPSTVVSKLNGNGRPPTPTSSSRPVNQSSPAAACSSSSAATSSSSQAPPNNSQDDVFQIAIRAEQLLKEILNKKTSNGGGGGGGNIGLLGSTIVKQEPQQPNEAPHIVSTPPLSSLSPSPPLRQPLHSLNHHFTMQPHQMMGQFMSPPPVLVAPLYNHHHHQGIQSATPPVSDPSFYARNPPPGLFMPQVVPPSLPPPMSHLVQPSMVPHMDMLRPQSNNRFPYSSPRHHFNHHHHQQQQQQQQPVQIVNTVVMGSGGQLYALANPTMPLPPPPQPSSMHVSAATIAAPPSLYTRFSAPNSGYQRGGFNKRKFSETNNGPYGKRFNKGYNDRFGGRGKEENGSKKKKKVKNDVDPDNESDDESSGDSNDGSDDDDEEDEEEESLSGGVSDDEDDEEDDDEEEEATQEGGLEPGESDDPNVARERELNELKSRSVVDKMAIFLDYYQQFRVAYVQRVQQIDQCPDSLRLQFNALNKYMHEYESVLGELNQIVLEHEREHTCKNNHRKTKKLFNKSKTFIRYDCSKRLQSNIFEYRRFISSQDRYAGMYDLIDMNNYLISLLPDIGVSVRRYINKCERIRQQELNENEHDEEESLFLSDIMNSESQDSATTTGEKRNGKEDETGGPTTSNGSQRGGREYESFSIGIDSLNRRLLERVENEESLDELVKERIVKWINKRQSKYILIFSEMDKLLNQHKDGECHAKFHSFLQFNLGKLITVCDSYHQKLKELLYSTTIKRKKKRKKVKLLPEVMQDVFGEIGDLKRTLEHTKMLIKRCNELKNKSNAAAAAANAAAVAVANAAAANAAAENTATTETDNS